MCEGGASRADVMTQSVNSEGHSCSDISQLLTTYGFDELCTSYDTYEFTVSDMCVRVVVEYLNVLGFNSH